MQVIANSGREKFAFVGGWLVVYLAIPFVALLFYVFEHGTGSSQGVVSAAYVSAITASVTTLILVILGLPLASHLAHASSPWASIIRTFIRLPLGIPPLVSGVMLLIAFGPYSFIGRIFGGRLVNSMIAIVLAQLLVEMPFVIEGSRSALSQLDPEVYEVSKILGIPNTRRLVGVEIPLALKTVRTAIMMGWLRAFGEFGATVLVAYHPTSLPVLIFTQFSGTGLRSAIMPVGGVLILSFVGALVISRIKVPSRAVLGLPGKSADNLDWNFVKFGDVNSASKPIGVVTNEISFAVNGNVGNFHLDVASAVKGKSLAITGPSGSGKSLTLRAIVGLMPSLLKQFNIGAIERPRVAFVPQGQALFGHLDVFSQLAIAARWAGGLKSEDEIIARVYECSAEVGISHLWDRKISTLSGGQKQRVALARAIASRPDLLVLDEPFSALDRPERDRQIRFVRNLVNELGLSLIVVTHDIEEAAFLANDILIVKGGEVVSQGSVSNLLKEPASTVVAGILGYENILDLDPGASNVEVLLDGVKVDSVAGNFVAFKSEGHSLKEFHSTNLNSFRCQIEQIGNEISIHGVFEFHDLVDLGNESVLILKYGSDSFLEFKIPVIENLSKLGQMVDISIDLEPTRVTLVVSRTSSLKS